MLSIGHITVDVNPGALPALLPILFFDLKLNYTTAALVITTANLTSNEYWLDMLSAGIRSFSSVAVAGLGLLAGAFGIPVLRGSASETKTEVVVVVPPAAKPGG